MEVINNLGNGLIAIGAIIMLAVVLRGVATLKLLSRTHNLPPARARYRDLEREDEFDERTRWN